MGIITKLYHYKLSLKVETAAGFPFKKSKSYELKGREFPGQVWMHHVS